MLVRVLVHVLTRLWVRGCACVCGHMSKLVLACLWGCGCVWYVCVCVRVWFRVRVRVYACVGACLSGCVCG